MSNCVARACQRGKSLVVGVTRSNFDQIKKQGPAQLWMVVVMGVPLIFLVVFRGWRETASNGDLFFLMSGVIVAAEVELLYDLRRNDLTGLPRGTFGDMTSTQVIVSIVAASLFYAVGALAVCAYYVSTTTSDGTKSLRVDHVAVVWFVLLAAISVGIRFFLNSARLLDLPAQARVPPGGHDGKQKRAP